MTIDESISKSSSPFTIFIVKEALFCTVYEQSAWRFAHAVRPYKPVKKKVIPAAREYLMTNLILQLHPRKIYLQRYTKGVVFLGAVIKPYRVYIANRAKANFYEAVHKYNRLVEGMLPSPELKKQFVCSINSYLGIVKHYRTAKMREHIISKVVSPEWWRHFYANGRFRKVILK